MLCAFGTGVSVRLLTCIPAWSRMIYELGHFFKNMLLPPVGLGWLLVVALWQFQRRPRFSRALIAFVVLAGFCLATPIVSSLLLRSVSIAGDATTYTRGQAVVILGAESNYLWDGQAAKVLDANPGSFTLQRLHFGARLARQSRLPILVSGGIVTPGAPTLAEVMRSALQEDFAVSARWIEDRSRNTAENAEFSARILLAENIRTVILVTSGFHLRRAVALFEKAGFTVLPAPVPPIGPPGSIVWKDFLPDTQSLLSSYYAFHELGGLVYGAMRR